MLRIFVILLAVASAGSARAAAPEFNTEHFCADFADKRGGGSMGGLASAVCVLSEQSTKTIVEAAWSHVSAESRETCLKAAGESYVSLAQCLNEVQGH
jgi:hypothetical protein